MKLPEQLSQWSLGTIQQLVREAEFEPGMFDYKAVLRPTSRHDEYRDDIRRAVCSMANTVGGYLLFGIADRRTNVRSPEKRIIGIPLETDLTHEFGQVIQEIRPDVHFEPMLRAIPLTRQLDKGVWVVHVPRSQLRPHEVKGVFYKRVDGGAAERMHANEVRDQMLLTEERMRKVVLLRVEIRDLLLTSNAMDRGMKGNSNLAFDRFDAVTFKALVADTCAILPQSGGLIGQLLSIGRLARKVNEALQRLNDHYLRTWNPEQPFGLGTSDIVRSQLYDEVRSHRAELEGLCKTCEKDLSKHFGPLPAADLNV